jgi:hypothetical protein
LPNSFWTKNFEPLLLRSRQDFKLRWNFPTDLKSLILTVGHDYLGINLAWLALRNEYIFNLPVKSNKIFQ